jgi:hypothetical protein
LFAYCSVTWQAVGTNSSAMRPEQTPDAAETDPKLLGQILSDGAAVVQVNDRFYVVG